jgi:hypothetical protein
LPSAAHHSLGDVGYPARYKSRKLPIDCTSDHSVKNLEPSSNLFGLRKNEMKTAPFGA